MEKVLTLSKRDILSICILDVLSGIAMYGIPTLSHMVAYPLYYFDPMRLIILLGFLQYRNKWNSAFLAITLPLVSYLLSGHPILFKNTIISIELLANIFVLSAFLNRKVNTFLAVIGSIVTSKFWYYGLKYAAISFGFLETNLVDTNIWYQAGVAVFVASIWWMAERRKATKW